MQLNILVVVEESHSKRTLVHFGAAVLIIPREDPIVTDAMRLILTNVRGQVLPANDDDWPKWPLIEFAEIDLTRPGGGVGTRAPPLSQG
jgi:hypothetical protein